MEPHELVRDADGGTTVVLDGHPQSYVAEGDPELLVFEYMQHFAAVLDCVEPTGAHRLTVTHIGGGGLTLARYLQHARPGSPQIVLEPDAALTEAVRRDLPLPHGHRIRVRTCDGRTGLAALREASADVIVLDAFARARVPAELTTVEALAECARVLAPSGLWMANLADEPPRRYVAAVAAAAAEAGLARQVLIAARDVHKGRRFGNSVLVASARGLPELRLRRRLARSVYPGTMLGEQEWARRRQGARAWTDAASSESPPLPDPGQWRVR